MCLVHFIKAKEGMGKRRTEEGREEERSRNWRRKKGTESGKRRGGEGREDERNVPL